MDLFYDPLFPLGYGLNKVVCCPLHQRTTARVCGRLDVVEGGPGIGGYMGRCDRFWSAGRSDRPAVRAVDETGRKGKGGPAKWCACRLGAGWRTPGAGCW